jgi:lyso-ornithine lipid O-acyltransferase
MYLLMKTFSIFFITFTYLVRSFFPNANVNELKKKWALQILSKFEIEIVQKNMCETTRQLILVGNHISFLDIIVLVAIHPEVVFLAKKEIASWPIIGAGAKRIGTIFVNRNSAESRAKAKASIKSVFQNKFKETHIAGFPSGTTTLYEEKPWKRGLFEIAQYCQVEIQPFRIRYAPLRECAYIDEDSLVKSLMLLFKTKNKKVFCEWGQAVEIYDLDRQLAEVKSWASSPESIHEEKILGRSSYTLEL